MAWACLQSLQDLWVLLCPEKKGKTKPQGFAKCVAESNRLSAALLAIAHTSAIRARSRNSCQQRSKRTAQSSRGDRKPCFSAPRFNHGRCASFKKNREI
tara:strand:- start:283 stop:579 length:297 start_codon:yes stop_codon:yes gene_type:complete